MITLSPSTGRPRFEVIRTNGDDARMLYRNTTARIRIILTSAHGPVVFDVQAATWLTDVRQIVLIVNPTVPICIVAISEEHDRMQSAL